VITIRVAFAFALSLSVAASASAQRPNRQMAGRGQGGRPGDARRNELEDEVRRGFARAVRERVGLNNDQMQKLGPMTRKFEDQRRQTQMDEREARTKLQALVLVGSDADSVRIKGFIAQLNDVRRRRAQIDEAEQKDLATIMTPLQQAKFLGIQEQVRRRLEQMRPMPGGPPPDGMPPGDAPPPEPGTAGADSGLVRVSVTPLTTRILVDDVEKGMGRQQIKVSAGSHRLTLSAPGCKTEEFTVTAGKNLTQVVTRALSCQ